MRYAIFEILEMVAKARGPKKKIAKLHEFSSTQLKTILDLTYNPVIQWKVPHDLTYKPCDDNMNTLRTRLFTESKRLVTFTNMGPYPNLDQNKMNDLFRTVLETIHPKDAELLNYIIEHRDLPYDKIYKSLIAEAFPIMAKNWGEDTSGKTDNDD